VSANTLAGLALLAALGALWYAVDADDYADGYTAGAEAVCRQVTGGRGAVEVGVCRVGGGRVGWGGEE
jgi:hypothetical protein